MDKFFAELGWALLWLIIGGAFAVNSLGLVQVMQSGEQYQVRYNKQNYLLVPCHQTQCK